LQVRSLHVYGDNSDPVSGNDLERAFSHLIHLHTLRLQCRIDLVSLINSFHGDIRELGYWPPFEELMVELLWRQDTIKSLRISEFNEAAHEWPADFLPNLARVEARPKNLAFLVASRPVDHIKFIYSLADFENRPVVPLSFIIMLTSHVTSLEAQLSQLLNGNPADLVNFLPHVEHLFLAQDASWGSKRSPAVRLDFLFSSFNSD
jgi:hypothetical protein